MDPPGKLCSRPFVSGPFPMSSDAIHVSPVVLLVEDEPFVRMATAEALEHAGFKVVEAANARAAQDVLDRRDDIRVLFTDIRMPGPVNGLELARHVHDRWPHIAVVITSAHLQPGSGEFPEWATFIAKPYGEQTPARTIRALLRTCGEAPGRGEALPD